MECASPFISTFKSLRAPVHRALRAREGAIVSIFDSSRLQTEAYSAQKLVKELGIKISGYRGVGEYLIWGRIPTPAIICSFTISNLVRIAEEDKEIGRLLQLGLIESFRWNRGKLHNALSNGPGKADRRSGLAIGRLLARLNLPISYAEGVARSFCYSWHFKKGKLDDYLQGVREGYLAPMTVPTAPETPSSPAQPEAMLEEESDDSLATSEEEEGGDDSIVPTIESPCPVPRDQRAPKVEFFDPRVQRWSENATGMGTSPFNPIQQDGEEIDQDMDVVIDELMAE